MTMILMSPENPEGWKLEELLAALQAEVQGKCGKIVGETERDHVALDVLRNNKRIIALLGRAEVIQRESYNLLHVSKGENQGPTGAPRIGVGAAQIGRRIA